MDFKITANTKTITKICEDLDYEITKLDKARKTKQWATVNKLLGRTTGMPFDLFYDYKKTDRNNVNLKVVMAGVGKGTRSEGLAIKEVVKRTKAYGKDVRIKVL